MFGTVKWNTIVFTITVMTGVLGKSGENAPGSRSAEQRLTAELPPTVSLLSSQSQETEESAGTKENDEGGEEGGLASQMFAVDVPQPAKQSLAMSSFLLSSTSSFDDSVLGDELMISHRNAVKDKSRRWPGGKVPYVIDSRFPKESREKILLAMREIVEDTRSSRTPCVQFVPRDREQNYLKLVPGRSCRSMIGYYNIGVQESVLGPQCILKGVIMHELLHTLGFYHEQNRPDRDQYVSINESNVAEKDRHDFRIRNSSILSTLDTAYDITSIMHYGPYVMAKNDSYPAMTPTAGDYRPDFQLGQRFALSPTDVLRVQRLYQCPEDTSHVTSDVSEDNIYLACSFHNDSCGLTSTHSAPSPQWTVVSHHTDNGPRAGSTNGLDPFLYVTHSSGFQTAQRDLTNISVKASVVSPTFNSTGEICVDMAIYQKHPGSYISLLISGPYLPRQIMRSYRGHSNDFWVPARISLVIPEGMEFCLELEGTLAPGGAVALDDLYVMKRRCT